MRMSNCLSRIWRATVLVALLSLIPSVWAQQRIQVPSKSKATTDTKKASSSKGKPDASKPMTVEELTEKAHQSLVVISHYGRDGKVDGVGSGFVVGADGLIATSFHVIGEARPIKVQFPDGSQKAVTEVYAWDRKLDLAILKVDADKLTPLPLGDSDLLKQGASVVALGNPQGLEYSVVQGVVSGRREFEYSEMIQLAIPLEPGNSGGPLLDMFGKVHGILTLKHAVTRNLGFAMPVNALKKLIEKPNPVPLGRWLTIATVNTDEWEPYFGARWVQRGGQLSVEGAGQGFGGRSVCLSTAKVPEDSFEVAVKVKMDDESGAAGLIFGGDNENEHFGLYPSNGRIRLTRFNGLSVYSWQVLKDQASPYYRSGDWNDLRVKVTGKVVECFVNDHLYSTISWESPVKGKVGVAKFRQTQADFKQFRVGKELPDVKPSQEVMAKVEEDIKDFDTSSTAPDTKLVARLQTHGDDARRILAERADAMQKEAEQLKRLASAVHERNVQQALTKVFAEGEAKADLFQAAMLVAKLDNEDLELEPYRKQVERMAREVRDRLPEKATQKERLKLLNDYLFAENGFRGSRGDYYNKANSYLNNVIDDREGIPITLSVLYLELAKRIGVTDMVGIGLPGHFVVQYRPEGAEQQFIDVFDGGKPLSKLEVELIVRLNDRNNVEDETLEPVGPKSMVVRMLGNLRGIALKSESPLSALRYMDTILALTPEDASERWNRALLRLQGGDIKGGRTDLRWLLDHEPRGLDMDKVAELYRSLVSGN